MPLPTSLVPWTTSYFYDGSALSVFIMNQGQRLDRNPVCPYRKSHLAANGAGTGCTFRREFGTILGPTGEACPVASLQ
jgi:hypothetical protein